MISRRVIKESQEQIKQVLAVLGDASAYDIADEIDRLDPPANANVAYAQRQRTSAGCSELHRLGELHQVGMKPNPSSGERVSVYRLNRDPQEKCPCGSCPDGGKGYKAKNEMLKEQMKEVVDQNDFLILRVDRLQEEIDALKEEKGRLQAKVDLLTKAVGEHAGSAAA